MAMVVDLDVHRYLLVLEISALFSYLHDLRQRILNLSVLLYLLCRSEGENKKMVWEIAQLKLSLLTTIAKSLG